MCTRQDDLASTLGTALGKVSSAAKISNRTVVVAYATLDKGPGRYGVPRHLDAVLRLGRSQ